MPTSDRIEPSVASKTLLEAETEPSNQISAEVHYLPFFTFGNFSVAYPFFLLSIKKMIILLSTK